MEILQWLHDTQFATFVRESESYFAFPAFLCIHTLGLSLVVGANGLVALRLLGIASSIPLKPLKKLFPFTWIGFALSWISGLALGVAAATTRLTNPILLVKVVLVMIAAYIMRIIEKRVFDNPDFKESQPGNAKILAGALVVLWVTITTMGRLIAYSASILGGG